MATAGPWSGIRGAKLDASLVEALSKKLAFPAMTPVQAAAIGPLLTNKDVCVDAETGSGKTLSYLVPIAQILLYNLRTRATSTVRSLVVLPTRELATQVHAVAKNLFKQLPGDLNPAPLIGGSASKTAGPDDEHKNDLRLVIATPGRLAAALAQCELDVSKLELLVLDEADRLLDMGFSVTLTDILTKLPRQRRTGIYSATQTAEVEALARAGLRNPVRVAVKVMMPADAAGGGLDKAPAKRQRVPASLSCLYQIVSPRDKLASLVLLLARHPSAKFIVYFMTCACVEYFRRLPLAELVAAAQKEDGKSGREISSNQERKFCSLHGKLSQKRRDRSLGQFASSENGVLLCTDVAARGIDVPDVDWVVQFDAPQDPDAYIHRVGRTARLGRQGAAVIFLAPSEDAYAEFLSVRRCPVSRDLDCEQAAGKIGKEVRDIVGKATLADRAILEAGEAAFLSYIRAYKEHRCRYLLKFMEIDVNSVGDCFGLLRYPKFYEFKKLRGKIEPRNTDGVVIRDVAYKDKVREKRRQEVIQSRIANRAQWKIEFKAKKAQNGKGKKRKRRKKNEEDENQKKGSKLNGKVVVRDELDEEDEDFEKVASQLKKVKRGKLSLQDFDQEAGYNSLADDEDPTS